jgi:hypothetical protein
MQLVEVSVTGVRSAVITLRSPGVAMRITLFPMLHLGSADYYRAVTGRLAACDLIVAEGIDSRSVTALAMALTYLLPSRSRRLGLTAQRIDYASLGVPVTRPDMTAPQFRNGMRTVPLWRRLAIWFQMPLAALSFALRGNRRTFSRYLDISDVPAFAEAQVQQRYPELVKTVLDDRDDLLADFLDSLCQTRKHEDIDIAVVYGAAHMRAVTRELFRRHGYRPRTADWITVFDF